MECSIVIADDHSLFAQAISEMLEKNAGCTVLYSVLNGIQLQEKFKSPRNIPDVVLLDINMPGMNGFETAEWLRKNHPEVHVLALSMNNSEKDILRMLKAGSKGYLLKDVSPDELFLGIRMVMEKGFYHSDLVAGHLMSLARGEAKSATFNGNLSDREKEFLKFAASEYSYKEIAEKMNVSERTVDGYRESIFSKLNVKTRTGMVIFAIKNGMVEI
jgi:DNA-binding NarL/FixJ family response regulator